MTAIYVIGEPDGPKKIGIAKNPRSRYHSIRTTSLLDVEILHQREVGPDAWKIEGHTHRLLRDKGIRGEWFKVSTQDAIAAIDAATLCVANSEPVGRSVGRKLEYPDRLTLPLAAGVVDRIDAVLEPGEPRLDLIRDAIDREVKRRERIKRNPSSRPD